ncbi:MAG: alpha-glucosidase C-terminal domain-containing protein [Actinobacteria bacterium]|nr:alpha-glucosidase C-terminal domain-containing protein [Actinomycetota bacterium]
MGPPGPPGRAEHPRLTTPLAGEPWWRSAVVYQIYPRSFADADGDGVGDLEGIRRHLDHLVWLGVDAVWVSPFFRSPMADFGYDVADYCDVDPLFGTLADFDRLLAEAHERGLKMLIDWVPNHTSNQHPWFAESKSSRSSPKRDWYVWRDRPNNWKAAFDETQSAWTWDEDTGQYYLHLFLPEQPDLNWANAEVVEAMHGVLRFWLDRGVDGFRIDVVHGLGKDQSFPDAPPKTADRPWSSQNDHESTHAILRDLRRLVDGYSGDRVLVGEVYLLSTRQVAPYYGDGDELHLAFNFPPLYEPWEAPAWRHSVERVVEELDPRRAWPTWVLSNHDNPRHRTRYGSEARARSAAVLLLTLRGTPFVYAGEELGLEDAEISPERRVDPGGRDGCRAPIPWDASAGHGWAGEDTWLPWPPEADTRSAAVGRQDEGSVLHLYRRLLVARRASVALRLGSWSPLPSPHGVLAYEREADGDRRAVVVNFTDEAVEVDLPEPWSVQVASDGSGEGERYEGVAGASQALLLSPWGS